MAGINAQTGSYVKIDAKTIDLTGYVTIDELETEIAQIQDLTVNDVSGNYIYLDDEINANMVTARDAFYLGDYSVSWKSKSIRSIGLSPEHNFVYKSGSTEYTSTGRLVNNYSDDTIYYLGR